MTSKCLCAKFALEFKFSDATILGLQKALSNLPFESDETKRYNLKLGDSAKQVSIENLLNLLFTSYQRINIDISDLNIDRMIQQNPQFVKEIQNPD